MICPALWCWSELTEQTPAGWWPKPSASVSGLVFLPGGEKSQGPAEDGKGAHFTLGKYGQLGHKDTTTLDRPCRVEYFVDKQLQVRTVSCGPWNTYVYAVEKEKS